MKKKKPHETLHITFHNPNAEEETIRRLTKIIVEALIREGVPLEPHGEGGKQIQDAKEALL
ncbi:MAG: hypothetical protein LBS18_02815 [Clostridiales bacterium]|nr:hypothetical protein [Clostridiales bacterium]